MEIRKLKKLEEEKLKLEIADLQKHWLKNPQYLQVLLPTTLAIFSLLYAITSGLFSSKQELLELNKKQLESDISSFQKEKANLISTNNYLKNQTKLYNDSLTNKDLILKKYENSFIKEKQKINSLNAELAVLKSTRNDYNVEISKLQKEYETKKQRYLNEIESKYYKELDYSKKNDELRSVNNQLREEIADLKFNVGILNSSPFIQKNKEYEFRQWTLNKMLVYYEEKGSKRKLERERLQKELEKLEKSYDSSKVKLKILKIK